MNLTELKQKSVPELLDIAQEMGLENVSHIDDGFSGWKKAGGPVGEKPSKHK